MRQNLKRVWKDYVCPVTLTGCDHAVIENIENVKKINYAPEILRS